MKLLELHIKNFKGIKDFTLEPNGENISVFGSNATGKTTLFDAVLYLLTGKDSQGRADFQIKPVDGDGAELHNLETSVKAVFDMVTLKKVYKEKYTKKRGQATADFTGHTTEYFIDDVPEKKKAFDEKIKSLINEKAFALLTNPFEFNNIHWQDRRQILINICGDVTDDDVIKYASLDGLKDILNGASIDDHQKKIKAKRQEINRELTEIPARIDELKNSLSDVKKPELASKNAFLKKLDEATKKKHDLSSPVAISEKRTRINEIDSEILKIKNDAAGAVSKRKAPIRTKIDLLEEEERETKKKISRLKDQVDEDQRRNKITDGALDTLRAEFKRENEKTVSIDTICPTCGQDMPDEKLETAQANFNKMKAEVLAENNRKGKEMSADKKQRQADIETNKNTINKLTINLADISKQITAMKKELDNINTDTAEIPGDLLKEKETLQAEIKDLESGSQNEMIEIQDNIDHFKTKIAEIEHQEASFNAAEKTRNRIAELEDQEKFLAGQFENLERDLFLIEKFIVAKVDMSESKINSKFSMARFKLFDEQINGGINEVCETLYNGVPFNSGLNNAARINVGLDIINTLSDHYNFHPPIFIDNRESVTELIETKSQQISLVVDGDYKELTWNPESKTKTEEAA